MKRILLSLVLSYICFAAGAQPSAAERAEKLDAYLSALSTEQLVERMIVGGAGIGTGIWTLSGFAGYSSFGAVNIIVQAYNILGIAGGVSFIGIGVWSFITPWEYETLYSRFTAYPSDTETELEARATVGEVLLDKASVFGYQLRIGSGLLGLIFGSIIPGAALVDWIKGEPWDFSDPYRASSTSMFWGSIGLLAVGAACLVFVSSAERYSREYGEWKNGKPEATTGEGSVSLLPTAYAGKTSSGLSLSLGLCLRVGY